MKTLIYTLRAWLLAVVAIACNSTPATITAAAGGCTAAAVVTVTVGTAVVAQGCVPTPGPRGTGGAPPFATGGAKATGGRSATGGAAPVATGGSDPGGASATGGTTSTVAFPLCNPASEGKVTAPHHRLGGKVTKPRATLRKEATEPVTGNDVFWPSPCTALDQGSVGSCTGNDATQTSSTPPYKRTCEQANESAALACYSAATKLDNGCNWNSASCSGSYPPNDTGSYATSAFAAASYMGWFTGTRPVVQTLQGWHDALLLGPCGFDQNWYNKGFTPSQCGEVALLGGLAGGHSTEAVGFDVVNQRMWLRNSWGQEWGVGGGYFWYSFTNLKKLLASGATMVCPALPNKTAANDVTSVPTVTIDDVWDSSKKPVSSKVIVSVKDDIADPIWVDGHEYCKRLAANDNAHRLAAN